MSKEKFKATKYPGIMKDQKTGVVKVDRVVNGKRRQKRFNPKKTRTPFQDAIVFWHTGEAPNEKTGEVKPSDPEEIKNGYKPTKHTLESYLDLYLKDLTNEWTKNTRTIVERKIRKFFDREILELRMDQIDRHEFSRFIERKVKEYKRNPEGHNQRQTYNVEIKLTKTMFNLYEFDNSTGWRNPINARHFEKGKVKNKDEKRIKKREFFTLEEVEEFISVLPSPYRELSLVQFLYCKRVGEVAGLTWGKIKWKKGTIIFNETANWINSYLNKDNPTRPTKTGGFEEVPILPEIMDLLKKLKPPGAKPRDFVFTLNGEGLSYKKIQTQYYRAKINIGLDQEVDGCTHLMRKSAANIIFHKNGIDAAQRLGNWSDIKTVQRHYTNLSPELVGEQFNNLSNMFFGKRKE